MVKRLEIQNISKKREKKISGKLLCMAQNCHTSPLVEQVGFCPHLSFFFFLFFISLVIRYLVALFCLLRGGLNQWTILITNPMTKILIYFCGPKDKIFCVLMDRTLTCGHKH